MAQQRRRSEEMARRILDAAATIFSREGFAGARMDEIARQAKVNKAMIYYHFQDKAALYAAVFLDAIERNRIRLTAALEGKTGPEEHLRAIITTIAEIAGTTPHLPSLMLREIASGGVNLPEPVLQGMHTILQMIRSILAEGSREASFRTVDPLLTHLLIIGSTMFITSAQPISPRLESLAGMPAEAVGTVGKPLGERIADLLLNGILARSATNNAAALPATARS